MIRPPPTRPRPLGRHGRQAVRRIVGASALAMLAACASGARKPDLTLPAAYEAPRGDSGLPPQALDRWWTIFGDDQLDQLEEQALKASPDANTQVARLREAIATRKSAILQTYPTGDITGGPNRQTTSSIWMAKPRAWK